MSKITFVSKVGEKVVESQPGQNLFALAETAGVTINNACGGYGTCGLCRVKLLSGSGQTNSPTNTEKSFVGSATLATGERLACQVVPTGDMRVEVL